MRGVSTVVVLALGALALATVNVKAAAHLPANDCCNCESGFNQEGEPVWTCPCTSTMGGQACVIGPEACSVRGICVK